MYKVSETVLPIYINGQCLIIKTCSDVTLNLSSKDSNCRDFPILQRCCQLNYVTLDVDLISKISGFLLQFCKYLIK